MLGRKSVDLASVRLDLGVLPFRPQGRSDVHANIRSLREHHQYVVPSLRKIKAYLHIDCRVPGHHISLDSYY
jgi:hypothetical protein